MPRAIEMKLTRLGVVVLKQKMPRTTTTALNGRKLLTPEEIYELITARSWPYRTWAPHYHKRDRCFLALLYLTAGRIGEVLSLRILKVHILGQTPQLTAHRPQSALTITLFLELQQ